MSYAHRHHHSHEHGHGHHHHALGADADRRWLAVALALIAGFMAAETIAGLPAGSLALLSDAMHMLTDAAAIALALVAARLAARPPGGRFTFGFGRFEILLRSGWQLVRDSGHVLLEAAPREAEPDAIGLAMARHTGVQEVHDLHIWEVTSGFPALSAHVLVRAGDDCHRRRRELEAPLAEQFAIAHTTLQVDHVERPAPLQIGHAI